MQNIETFGAPVSGQNIGGGIALWMADVQSRAGRVGEHVQDIIFRRQLRCGNLAGNVVALRKRMTGRNFFIGIKSTKTLLLFPKLLPLRLNQMKRILSAHKIRA